MKSELIIRKAIAATDPVEREALLCHAERIERIRGGNPAMVRHAYQSLKTQLERARKVNRTWVEHFWCA